MCGCYASPTHNSLDRAMDTSLDRADFVNSELHLPPELHAHIQAAAQDHGSSLNGEILLLLQEALGARGRQAAEAGKEPRNDMLDRFDARLRRELNHR